MELSSQWAKALEPNILQYMSDGFAEHPDSTTEVFSIDNQSAGIIRYRDSFGPRLISKSAEGAATPEANRQDGYPTNKSPQTFKQKVSATTQMIRWNRYPEIFDDAKQLGSAAIQTLNLFANAVFINAFSTSYLSYGDNRPLCSTIHSRPDGGTAQSNASSTGITLTEANLETAMIALKQQKSGTGKKLALGSGNLVLMVPEQLEKEAVIITGSTKRSGTTDNDLKLGP